MNPKAVPMDEEKSELDKLMDKREKMIAEMAELARRSDQQSSITLMRMAKEIAGVNRMINEECKKEQDGRK